MYLKTIHQLKSVYLQRTAVFEIFNPDNLPVTQTVNLLLFNDGQDVAAVQVENILQQLYDAEKIDPVIVVAVKASADRLQEYGVAGMPDFMGRGSKAALYTHFIVDELLPFVHATLKTSITGKRVVTGCSLGGLTAFDLAWNNGGVFDAVGVFSGSFWWRKKNLEDGYVDGDRIMHRVIRNTLHKPVLKFWLMTGTEDETEDRNHNFIIDSIDDTIDIIKELVKKGYKRPGDIFYYEAVGGQHNTETWAKAMPAFLTWAFQK